MCEPVAAQVQPYPASFQTRRISTNGVTLYVRVGGKGPAVLLLHRYGETGDMWTPVASKLVTDHARGQAALTRSSTRSVSASGFSPRNSTHCFLSQR